MHLLCFDIDGTLVRSAGFDEALYAAAIQDVLDVAIDTDWSQYENVTDSGILETILKTHTQPGQRLRITREIRSIFINRTKQYLSDHTHAVGEVPGACALLEQLRKSPGVCVCLATGGWRETAAMKLRAIGLEPDTLVMATGSDAVRRTDIMRLAESRATRGAVVRRRTYFGDGVWDQRAAAALDYDFIAVGGGVSHPVAFPDLQDLEAILTQLDV